MHFRSETPSSIPAPPEPISNFGGTVTSLGYNLSSDNGGGHLTGPGDQINTDPLLGPLQDNGGPTLTHTLLPGSPAIDVGDPNFTPPPFFDQRGPGFDRVVNGRIDNGSFEVQTQTVAIQLRASGRKVGGINTVRLTWTGATSNNVDVNRGGVVIATVPNTDAYSDSTGETRRARFTYKVCEAGALDLLQRGDRELPAFTNNQATSLSILRDREVGLPLFIRLLPKLSPA